MNTPFPLNPDVGDWSGDWAWNGARWVSAATDGLRVRTQVFTQSGPYMPTPGLVSCVVECVGGGGGSGDAGPTPDATWILGGGGGGSGGYSRKTLPGALVRGGVLVTVGQGGPPVFGQAETTFGGATSFGALCVANGGMTGAGFNLIDSAGVGGAGASPGVGDLALSGIKGFNGPGWNTNAPIYNVGGGGRGGWIFGGARLQQEVGPGSVSDGVPGDANTGAGADGAIVNQLSAGQANGVAGASGVCIVTEYVVGDRDQPEASWRPPLDVNVSFPRPPWPGGQPGPVPPWPPGAPWWPWPPNTPMPPRPPGPQPRELEYEADQPPYQPWDDPNAGND